MAKNLYKNPKKTLKRYKKNWHEFAAVIADIFVAGLPLNEQLEIHIPAKEKLTLAYYAMKKKYLNKK